MASVLIGCENRAVVRAGWVAGADRGYSEADWDRHGEQDVVLDQASRDLDCPVPQLIMTQPYGRAYVVNGCGRRGVFVTVKVETWSSDETRPVASWTRAFDVCAPGEPPGTPAGTVSAPALDPQIGSSEHSIAASSLAIDPSGLLERRDATIAPPPAKSVASTWNQQQVWTRLVMQGARDLRCPPDQVTPDFVPQGRWAPSLPIVEGCGKRATYLAERADVFRLSAIVDAAIGAP